MEKKILDPLYYLKNELGCQVFLDSEGRSCLEFGPGLGIISIMQAQSIVKEYEPLLLLQLYERDASVEDLIASNQIHIYEDKVLISCTLAKNAA